MQVVNKIKLDLLKIKKGDKVLDIGCSFGEQAMAIAREGAIVYGIDSSPRSIKEFKHKAKKDNLNCHAFVSEATRIPFKDNYFDAIIATEVFEHIPNAIKAINESFRVLVPQGRACISVPSSITEKIFMTIHPFWLQDSGHVNVFSKKEILTLLKNAGFKIEKVEDLNFEWTLFWLIHSFLKTRFDSTGSPRENYKISDRYSKIWNYMFKIRIGKYLLWLGNKLLPKSYYVYVLKKNN